MKVKSIELLQLKSYDHIQIDLSDSITLLVGPNNSGKSTIIKSLLNSQYSVFSHSDVRAGYNYCKVITEVVGVSESENDRFVDQKNPQRHVPSDAFKLMWNFPLRSDLAEEYVYSSLHNRFEVEKRGLYKIKDKEGNHVDPTSFSRFSDREDRNNFIYPLLSRRKTDFYRQESNREQAVKVDESLRNLAVKIQKLSNSSHPKSEEFSRHCQEIIGCGLGVIPIEHDSISGIEPGVYVTDTKVIPLRNMGDGVANIVGALVTLLTEDAKLYLIEELENDIHPEALKKLLSLILQKAKKNQFVISTHSNIVVKHLGSEPSSLIYSIQWSPFFNEESDKIPTSTIIKVGSDSNSRLQLLRNLGYEFSDYELYDGFLLLEESSAEKIIRDILIPAFAPKLAYRLKTISAQGVNDVEPRFIDLHRLFVFVHGSSAYADRAWVIVDGDSAGRKCLESLNEKFPTWKNNFMIFDQADFEFYYPSRFSDEVGKCMAIVDKAQRRKAKRELLLDVMNWFLNSRDQCLAEFEQSAKEVIAKLIVIERSFT